MVTVGVFWIRTDGTVSASPGGEEQDVMSPWKPFALTEKTMKEVRIDMDLGNSYRSLAFTCWVTF